MLTPGERHVVPGLVNRGLVDPAAWERAGRLVLTRDGRLLADLVTGLESGRVEGLVPYRGRVVFVFDGGTEASAAALRRTRRIVAALSAPTAEGVLYEVDMKLRPSGGAGPSAPWRAPPGAGRSGPRRAGPARMNSAPPPEALPAAPFWRRRKAVMLDNLHDAQVRRWSVGASRALPVSSRRELGLSTHLRPWQLQFSSLCTPRVPQRETAAPFWCRLWRAPAGGARVGVTDRRAPWRRRGCGRGSTDRRLSL